MIAWLNLRIVPSAAAELREASGQSMNVKIRVTSWCKPIANDAAQKSDIDIIFRAGLKIQNERQSVIFLVCGTGGLTMETKRVCDRYGGAITPEDYCSRAVRENKPPAK